MYIVYNLTVGRGAGRAGLVAAQASSGDGQERACNICYCPQERLPRPEPAGAAGVEETAEETSLKVAGGTGNLTSLTLYVISTQP